MTKVSHVVALIALTLIPSAAMATVLATAPGTSEPFNPFQSIGGTTISGIAIGSWTWIFKWMVNQLELQRQAHAESQSQLIQYMKEDHALIASTNQTLTATNQTLTSALTMAINTLNKLTLATTNHQS